MILEELFGKTARIKIMEELLSKWGQFLTAEEISTMAEVSKKTVYIHMNKLEELGLITVEKKSMRRYKLNENDERALALGLIETNEYSRQNSSMVVD
ncbi:winged helix-turn-helix domain-containing protein [Methanosphaera sp. WGK6]|uniref:winged helix-turn-helix domain-containing protein n=1 Tax=Methanosphaera sp. WGK6 TaxID=1561964 RepID=UPI00084C7E2F|nr:winged helix-turn-helix domain-containing protein [Methanosphaera sp. WGK6]OED29896.1 hypothetical protein NL43_05650 [Methanosphaera sp. WGK6]